MVARFSVAHYMHGYSIEVFVIPARKLTSESPHFVRPGAPVPSPGCSAHLRTLDGPYKIVLVEF